jgi:segregation and condensation protein A
VLQAGPGEYTVKLDRFQGPLDLLLHLIRRAELDVTDIALAQVTDQYLSYIESLDEIDVDEAGEFLVVAATLIEVKSRLVNPEDPGEARRITEDEADEGDPAVELVKQLLAYRAYRDAGAQLEAQRDEWLKRFPSGRAHADRRSMLDAVGGEDALDMDELDLFDIVRAFQKIIDTVEFSRLGTHEVGFDDTPIELHAADVLDQLKRAEPMPLFESSSADDEAERDEAAAKTVRRRLPFASLFTGRSKPEVIGLFLAILELVKQRAVAVVAGPNHAEDASDIVVELISENAVSIAEPDSEGDSEGEGEAAADDAGDG